jgi:hypothetical protein
MIAKYFMDKKVIKPLLQQIELMKQEGKIKAEQADKLTDMFQRGQDALNARLDVLIEANQHKDETIEQLNDRVGTFLDEIEAQKQRIALLLDSQLNGSESDGEE